MFSTLKNLKNTLTLIVLFAAAAPQVASAHGGGGMGGSRMMTAPAYHRAPSHPAKTATPVSPIIAKLPPGSIGKVYGTTGTTTSTPVSP